MFIVSFPYAVLQGGYWALLSMILIAYICCHTGKILVDCLYEEDDSGNRVRVRHSYVEIAEEVWGRKVGGKIVNVAQLIELIMTCILYLVLCGDLLLGSFPNSPVDLSSWIMISCAFLLPCAFLKTLRHVSVLSFWCTVAHLFINGIILIYCFTKAAEWKWSEVQVKIDIWTFPISLGIVVFSYTSQIFLPSLEVNMVDRSKFHCMLHWTHLAAAVFKALFSYIGFVTWGKDTKEVITNNLPSETLKIIVNLILVVKALLSYPLPFFAAVELLQVTFFQGRPKTYLPTCFETDGALKVWGLALRLLLVVVTLILAITIPHFAILMGFIGSFTGTMLSFLWPCIFHLKIKGSTLKWYQKAMDIIIIILGLLFCIIGMYYSGHALFRAFRGLPPNPFVHA
ncbi:vesicular inhibitory amino acid transporter-like [Lingula anatina]|uniref:Vesicular inhibitory amino acid transporter n=1 Tax=Lingula anatina TaxID=7574 RepID=A0A2R2MK96_LINAN|nr:vesicular inhibitory amino acid transporter-like [Lingula anatina]|eukprot:XP_023930620.1 vesicular inhibitory amino acid transporter-like [Lingula anatina]